MKVANGCHCGAAHSKHLVQLPWAVLGAVYCMSSCLFFFNSSSRELLSFFAAIQLKIKSFFLIVGNEWIERDVELRERDGHSAAIGSLLDAKRRHYHSRLWPWRLQVRYLHIFSVSIDKYGITFLYLFVCLPIFNQIPVWKRCRSALRALWPAQEGSVPEPGPSHNPKQQEALQAERQLDWTRGILLLEFKLKRSSFGIVLNWDRNCLLITR